ncbi:hypothetical protein [Polluticoccus soli]|uniref:hypothetical protein n=1 Tax=Polluticoccus soli TaxID=3034150 RepID=UPI0023E28A1F|nr:hypothetical protein [Flavipsychrobacter sp. JY13-12]
MFGSAIVDVGIGLIVVFILVSTICTAVREGIESILKTRAAYLEHGIRQLLHDKGGNGLAKELYQHPLVSGIFSGDYKPADGTDKPGLWARGRNLPSYINAKNFSQALMDIAAHGKQAGDINTATAGQPISLEAIRKNVAEIQNPQVQRVLLHAVNSAQGDMNKAQKVIEDWFNSGMDRVSGWYKRSTQMIIFGIAVAVVVSMNINTLRVANYLSVNQSARELVVKEAGTITANGAPVDYKVAESHLQALTLPIGWDGDHPAWINSRGQGGAWNSFWGVVLGWLITAFAATLGAPFWFDILNKIMVVRSTVKPKEKSQDEGSEDRQPAPPRYMQLPQSPLIGQPQPTTADNGSK